MSKITLIDYGAGNLLNVQRAFEHCGAEVNIATTPEQILTADRLVFPGVGAFPQAMAQLQKQNLVDTIKEAANNKPFLGICLGMQMLLDQSDEFELTQGLGLIAGQVKQLPSTSIDGQPMTIPHMGWSQIHPNQVQWQGSLLADIDANNAFYFVHSFYADVADAKDQLAVFDFGGHAISAALQKDNIIGCQFHPEKSGEMGLKIIESFLQI
ncbi:imidazole glycerol phosphate synthase subunit HisH [Thiomicrorhabdus sediminis]|uniref:Imidazole glycerol phosphate synthase subunit HisH n=1 Tax=Thiomicrorhabdus sediminis TaxID=2580412 RepID=A0A4V1HHW8_9GAMM|nr:imidazole glycerol phosphate synthase subunit HisH [Thiomicrorhabdus sediminis]QCU90473.1 imidazole glycerol phosphate synthase subunit HisH [Thiomicrorhabdus sediminis]